MTANASEGKTPARQLRDAMEPIATLAYWSPKTGQAMADLGIKGLDGYVCGRAGALGATNAAVVSAAFAWFEPSRIQRAFERGSTAADLGSLSAVVALRRARAAATADALREILAGDDPSSESQVLTTAVAGASDVGRPLFAGRRAQVVPADPAERLWWAAECLREHRGDSHVAAAVAAGLGPIEMNILTELWVGMPLGTYTATRGWAEADVSRAVDALSSRGLIAGERLTDAGLRARLDIEAVTDQQDHLIVESIGDQLPALCERLEEWSARVIDSGIFPNDPHKRSAG